MEDTRARWERAYLEALDFDTWGQVEEAIEGYQKLQVAAAAEYLENVLQLPIIRREGIGKLAAALKYRIQELSSGQERPGLGLKGMKAIKAFMKDMIISDVPFPLPSIKPDTPMPSTPTLQTAAMPDQGSPMMEEEDEPSPSAVEGGLRERPTDVARGDVLLSIFIEKWGFKEAAGFYQPRVTISVRDKRGFLIGSSQETPIAKRSTATYVFFEETVHIQTPVNNLPDGAAIFFEFKHYKIQKKKKSTKAYCFMEMDEIKDGPVTLEVYKKPTDFKRTSKPRLLTVKNFFLHLDLSLEEMR